MNVVILHCHFQRGGVTQVVENHLGWLSQSDQIGQVLLISGQRADGLSEPTRRCVRWIPLDGFDYDRGSDQDESRDSRAAALSARLAAELQAAGFTKDDTVLHWHNHSLGKNTAAPAMIRRLAASGWRILLQIHDFAEDNRPQNYAHLIAATKAASPTQLDCDLFPIAPQIDYAVLTQADRAVLTQLGIPQPQAHWLPNSVAKPGQPVATKEHALAVVRQTFGLPSDARWSLYPVRGIRRKNVGELLLISRWLPSNHFLGISLEPTTPIELRSYQRWKMIAAEVAPRVIFNAGHQRGLSFANNLAAAESILSTSVAEGFGMTFLEPWLAGREVIARRLAHVVADFEASGLRFPKFYDQIRIPGSDAWLAASRAEIDQALQAAWAGVPSEFRPDLEVNTTGSDDIDFAKLTPRRQIETLRRAASDPGFEAEIKARSAQLVRDLAQPADPDLIANNAAIIEKQYSIENIGSQLIALYRRLMDAGPERTHAQPGDATSAVALVNRVRDFYPCRTEEPVDE